MASELGFDKILVQSDCAAAVTLIQSNKRRITEVGSLVELVRARAATFAICNFVFISRSCNSVAHVLAKKALDVSLDLVVGGQFSFRLFSPYFG